MQISESGFSFPRMIRSLLLTALAVALFLVVKNEDLRFLYSHATYGLQALISGCSDGTLGQDGGVDLYIGSSMFRQGLDIDELEAGAPGDSYILSYNGTRAFQCEQELEYVLDHDVPIRHLYVDLYAYALSTDPGVEDTKLFADTDLAFKWSLWKEIAPYTEHPVKSFWEMFVTSNTDRLLCYPVDYPLLNSMFYRGGSYQERAGMTKEPAGAGEDAEETANAEQLRYLVKLIELCRDKEIPVTFIETPKYESTMESKTYLSLMQQYLAVLDRYQQDYILVDDTVEALGLDPGNVRVISFDCQNLDYFADAVHMSTDGKKAFTRILVDALGDSSQGETGE